MMHCLEIDSMEPVVNNNEPSFLDIPDITTQIFVHAGVDEDIPEEEMAYCTLATPEYVMTGKYPPTIGKFYKDIIAGHVATRTVAKYADHSEGRGFRSIFYDGYSHYYID